MGSTLIPISNLILVQIEKETSVGRVILPDNHKTDKFCRIGTVLASGPGKQKDDGTREPMPVKDGDRVVVSKYAGEDVRVGGADCKMIRPENITAIVSGDSFRPMNKYVLIRIERIEKRHNIIMPDTHECELPCYRGVVVAQGEGCDQLSTGDRVFFDKMAGNEVFVNNIEHRVVKNSDVFAVEE